MKSLRFKLVKTLAWSFWKLHIITEKDYVNLMLTLVALDAELKIKVVNLDDPDE